MAKRVRRIFQVVLVTIGVLALGGAAYRVISTRQAEIAKAAASVAVEPSSGPTGLHPFVSTRDWNTKGEIKLEFCSETAGCTDFGTLEAGKRERSQAIPSRIEGPSAKAPTDVKPGRYEIVATSGTRKLKTPFTVVAFKIGNPPAPVSYASADPRSLEVAAPREVAKGAACQPSVLPDGRFAIGRTLFDPSTAVTQDLVAQGAELVWSGAGEHLAIITSDRKEIRLASPDGSGAQTVVREARGLLSSVSFSSAGDHFAFVARPDPSVQGGPARAIVRVFSLLDGASRDVVPGNAVVWNPSGDTLAVEASGAIFSATLDGKTTRLTDGVRPAWSPDGALLAFVRPVGGETGEGWLAKSDGSAQTRFMESGLCGVDFSADGRRLVVTSGPDGGSVLSVRELKSPALTPQPAPRM